MRRSTPARSAVPYLPDPPRIPLHSARSDPSFQEADMARLTPITSKDQVAPESHPVVDAITKSRGALQGPFSMFLHAPELAGRVAHLGAYVRFEGGLDMRVR